MPVQDVIDYGLLDEDKLDRIRQNWEQLRHEPIELNGTPNHPAELADGHHRLQVAQELGEKSLPARYHYIPYDDEPDSRTAIRRLTSRRPEWADGDFTTKDGDTYHTVTEPNSITMRTPEGRMAGFITWGETTGEIGNVRVRDEHQRRGIATELLRRAREHRPDLQHSDRLSDEAQAWLRGIGERTAAKKRWYHGSPRDLQPGDELVAGLDSTKPDGDHEHVWISDDPRQAAKYGDVYEVDVHHEPKQPHRGWPEYHVPTATVRRYIGNPRNAPIDVPDSKPIKIKTDNADTYSRVWAEHGGKEIGSFGWEHGTGEILGDWVHPDYADRGIAEKMRERAQKMGLPKEAIKPRPTGKIPEEQGLYWRLHPKGREFSRADASSKVFYPPDPPDEWSFDDPEDYRAAREHWEDFTSSKPGYSAYTSPHHVEQYAQQRNLNTHDADVIGFHGKQVGWGPDDEPLVMPHHDKPFMRMPYEEFQRRLRRTKKPWNNLELDEDDMGGWGDEWGDHYASRKTALDDEIDTSYHMLHRPADRDGIPLHDLTNPGGELSLPEDVYTHPHRYDFSHEPSFWESFAAIQKARGKPEAKIRIYRSLPAEHAHHGFQPGDWVTTSKSYARQHSESQGGYNGPEHHWPVISTVVKANDLHTDGNDLREWGYNGPHRPAAQVSFKGGYHQEVRQHADGIVRPVKRRKPKEGARARYLTPWHYKRLTFTDYPGRDINYVSEALHHRAPKFMAALTEDIRQNGIKHPIEIAHHGEGAWEVGQGHHRLIAAWKLGHPVPFVRTEEHGDYMPPEEYYADNDTWREKRRENPEEYDAYMRRGEADDPFQGKWAAREKPKDRIFGPTYGLDHRLFDGTHLKPIVRQTIMDRLDQVLRVDSGLTGSDWTSYIEVYLGGSEASEWTGPNLEGNNDFDTLLGINYDELRGHDGRGASAEWIDKTDTEIDDIFNDVLRRFYNDDAWTPPWGGTWSLTGFVNDDAWDIQDIKPYAAYDISKDRWAVKPPHLPDWGPDKFPEGPALWKEIEAVEDYIDAIESLPEPFRSQQGAALYEHLHSDRHRAFGPDGEGWYDPGNVLEKALDQSGYWARLLKIKKDHDAGNHLQIGKTAATSHPFLNPYHGDEDRKGVRPEWAHTWFHGLHGNNTDVNGKWEIRESDRPGRGRGGPQMNKLLGRHFSSLHEVAHRFTGHSTQPSALIHAELNFKNPAHFADESHLDRVIFRWARDNWPGFHNEEMNEQRAWNGSHTSHTLSELEAQKPTGDPDKDLSHEYRLRSAIGNFFQWHPDEPEIARGFVQHLHSKGHHGITYGNVVEGPYYHVSAIATDPSQIKTTHVEHVAPRHAGETMRWGEEVPAQKAHEVTHEKSGELNESESFLDKIEKENISPAKSRWESRIPAPRRSEYRYQAAKTAKLDLPPEQEDAFEEPDFITHRRKMLQVAKNPPVGTHIWRGETRPKHLSPQEAAQQGVGMHWTVNPDAILHPWPEEGHHNVIWHGVIENPQEQTLDRSHPIWHGKHYSEDSEAEVRLRHGTRIKLKGAYIWHPEDQFDGAGRFVPRFPERNSPKWSYHPLDVHSEITHRPIHDDVIDYSDIEGFGKHADYRMRHKPPTPDAGHQTLDHYDGGGPDEHVRIYRAVPHDVRDIESNTWISLNPEYAHGHGRHSTDPNQDWPVLTATVPKKHVYWDENDENEHGYHGPPIREADVHDEETGNVIPRDAYDAERDTKGLNEEPESHMGTAVHLPPEVHRIVHDESRPVRERAELLFKHLPEKAKAGRGSWTDDNIDASFDAEDAADKLPQEPHRPTQVILHSPDRWEGHTGISWHPDYLHDEPNRYVDVDDDWHHHNFGGFRHEGVRRTARLGLDFRTRSGKRGGRAHTMISAHDGGEKVGHVRMTEGGTEVDDLHVKPSRRGEGIGHALMEEAIRQFGHNTLRLHASPFGKGGLEQEPLMDFYAAHGFESEPERGRGYMIRQPGRNTAEAGREEYGGVHSPLEYDPPLHAMHEAAPHLYRKLRDADIETISQMQKARGNPRQMVTIYRAMPKNFSGQMNKGDWISLSHDYAQEHADNRNPAPDEEESLLFDPLPPEKQYHVYQARVPAEHVRSGGNDLSEWGYWGPSLQGEHSSRCGSPHEGLHSEAQTRYVPTNGGQGDISDSMMVAIVPPADVAEGLALDDEAGLRAEELHITLLYLGKASSFTEKQLSQLPTLIQQWAKTQEPVTAKTQGAGTFVNEGNHCMWASVDIPGGTRMHDSLADFLQGHGLPIKETHGFIPHITLKYDKYHVRFLPKVNPETWTVDEVWFCRSGEWVSYPLGR